MKKPIIRKYKSIILWGGWYGSRNIGDRLLLLSIADLILKEIGPFRLIVFTAKPNLVFEYVVPNKDVEIKAIRPKKKFFALLRELFNCDLFVFGGAVPFFDQPKQLFDLLTYAILLRIFNKPYFLWGVSSLTLRNGTARSIVKFILDGSEKITCRDKYTIEEFRRTGSKREMEIVLDAALSLEDYDFGEAQRLLEKYLKETSNKPLYALTPRTLRSGDQEADTHYNTKTQEDIEKQLRVYARAIDWLVEHQITPVFIPMNTLAPDDDRVAAKEIMKRSRYSSRSVLIDEMIMPRTAPALYQQCIGSLVSRVHGSVTSFLGGCPVIMYGFETKHHGIMESIGLEEFIYDPALDSDEKISTMLNNVITRQNEIQMEITLRRNNLLEQTRIPAKYLGEILERNHKG